MINDIAFYFLCAFTAYGVVSMGFDLWGMWLTHRNEKVCGKTGRGKYKITGGGIKTPEGWDTFSVEGDELFIDEDEHPSFRSIAEQLCAPSCFPPGNSVDSAAAPEGEEDPTSIEAMLASHARYMAGEPDGVPYLDPDDDEPCEACAECDDGIDWERLIEEMPKPSLEEALAVVCPEGDEDEGWIGPHLDDCHRVPCARCKRK